MNTAGIVQPEQFAALGGLPVVHGFVGRVPGVDVLTDRATALERLEGFHREARSELGLGERQLITAEQVHGEVVVVVGEGGNCQPGPCREPTVSSRIAWTCAWGFTWPIVQWFISWTRCGA